MSLFNMGEIIKIQVIGSQHYGIFVKSVDDESYTGLIHISEISNDFVKDVSKVAQIGDILYAKILDVDNVNKHIKLSIKACGPKVRYKSSNDKSLALSQKQLDFKVLEKELNGWVQEQLKEKRKHD